MTNSRIATIVAAVVSPLASAAACAVAGQPAATPATQAARVVDFKKVGDVTLRMHIVGAAEGKGRTAIVLFFCGAWKGFDWTQYFPQSEYFASRGAICFNAEVRSTGVHKTTPVECVLDAQSAIRWVRQHAEQYGVAADRVVAFGASAGGHVSLCAALVDDFKAPGEEEVEQGSARPDAVMIACPVTATHTRPELVQRFGGEERARTLSPILRVKPKAPPTLIMMGDADDDALVADASRFADAMQAAGNRCELKIYPKAGHGFHNYFDGKNPRFSDTLREMDKFLASLGMLSGPPTIDSFHYTPISDPSPKMETPQRAPKPADAGMDGPKKGN